MIREEMATSLWELIASAMIHDDMWQDILHVANRLSPSLGGDGLLPVAR